MAGKTLDDSLQLLPLALVVVLIKEWYVREVSTTSIPLEIFSEIAIS